MTHRAARPASTTMTVARAAGRTGSQAHADAELTRVSSPTTHDPGLAQEQRSNPVAMQPIHRLADLGQRPDGGVEWACPHCGHYLVRYPHTQLVVAAGAPGPVHVLGSRYQDDPTEVPTKSEFDEQFLHGHAIAW